MTCNPGVCDLLTAMWHVDDALAGPKRRYFLHGCWYVSRGGIIMTMDMTLFDCSHREMIIVR